MSRCPISYDEVAGRYSLTALHRLHPRLSDLHDLPYTSEGLRQEARERAVKLSIQGLQPKLSARINLKDQVFELVDRHGQFILKPQHPDFKAVPENEDLTMKLAALAGVQVPAHGLVHGSDGALTYWIRRFDRVGRHQKLHVEDFAQLSGASRDTKYRSSLEKVAELVGRFTTFPQVEAVHLLRQVLISFLCGNEDQHLKNFSVIRQDNLLRLSPAYDLVNTTILLKEPQDETALPLRGKKHKFRDRDFLVYLAVERLGLTRAIIERTLTELAQCVVRGPDLIDRSFLPAALRSAYLEVFRSRHPRLGLHLFELDTEDIQVLERAGSGQPAGRHPSFFRQLGRQREATRQCLTDWQIATARERVQGSGIWQEAYARVAKMADISSPR